VADSDGPPKKRLPRDAAGSLELQGGTGGITAMCSCREFLEVYKEDVTFRVRTPESIDPARTNPNAGFVAAMTDTVGSASPAVARILLQGCEIFEAAALTRAVDKSAVVQTLHSCKEAVVVCEKVAERVAGRVDAIVAEVEAAGGLKREKRGRALHPFPQVADLDSDATSFLIQLAGSCPGSLPRAIVTSASRVLAAVANTSGSESANYPRPDGRFDGHLQDAVSGGISDQSPSPRAVTELDG